jgi:Uma2 family endonuclease
MAVSPSALAASAQRELADLEEVYQSLEIPGHRVELLDGCVVVSPTASRPHSRVVQRLVRALSERIDAEGWEWHANLTLHVAATRERLIPDLMIAPPEAPQFSNEELYGHGALLVVEVTSPSTRGRDRVAKQRAYAQAGVPLYLIADGLTDPATVRLLGDPHGAAYGRCDQVNAGKPVPLPEPFGITLDTGSLFV